MILILMISHGTHGISTEKNEFHSCSYSLRAGRVIDGQIMHPARVLRQPADSCLSSGGLETKPTKIQASGGRKPPDSIDIAHR